jgi:hypothetical protein
VTLAGAGYLTVAKSVGRRLHGPRTTTGAIPGRPRNKALCCIPDISGTAVLDRLSHDERSGTTILSGAMGAGVLRRRHLRSLLKQVLADQAFMAEPLHALIATMISVEFELGDWPAHLTRL